MFIDIIFILISIINTLVRLLPISLYSGTLISNLIFNDFRANLLFIGFLFNELISFAYKKGFKGINKPECALLSDKTNYYVLPSSITQTVGFFYGFMLSNTYYENNYNTIKFIVLSFMMGLTIFSRINVGCESSISAFIFASIGAGLGIVYYTLIKDYYKKELEDIEEDVFFNQ